MSERPKQNFSPLINMMTKEADSEPVIQSVQSLINLITMQSDSGLLIGFTNAACHRHVISLSLAVATLTWSSNMSALNTAIRGLECSYSKASMDDSGCESKRGMSSLNMHTPHAWGANCRWANATGHEGDNEMKFQ